MNTHLRKIIKFVTLLTLSLQVNSKEIHTYMDGDTELEGVFVKSSCEAPKAALLLIHQWKGLGEYEIMRANMYSKSCVDVLAIDMYGKGIRPESNEEAKKYSSMYSNNASLSRPRLLAAYKEIQQLSKINIPISVAGYCFGGTMALELARTGVKLRAAISFHGGLTTTSPVKKRLQTNIAIHHGAADPYVEYELVAKTLSEFRDAGAYVVLHQYADTYHSFTDKESGNNPAHGKAYNSFADNVSYAQSLRFILNEQP